MVAAQLIFLLGLTSSTPLTIPDSAPTALMVEDLSPFQPVPVLMEKGVATIDLPASEEGRNYLLILGAASTTPADHSVTVNCQPAARSGPIALDWPREDPFWKDLARSRRWQMEARRSLDADIGEPHATGKFAETRSFYLFKGEEDFHDVDSYEKVTAQLVSVGEHCVVYVDVDDMQRGFASAVSDYVVETFDRHVYPLTAKTFGNHRDVDRNGKFTILLTHWLNNLSNGKVSLGGFVRGGDFYRDIEAPYSNRCDMMYLNSNLLPGDHLRTLLAHEYTHAITFSEHVFGRYLIEGSQSDEQTWLSEAISHLAENIAGSGWSNLDYRIATYLTHPNQYRLVVPDYYSAGLWRCHGSRGSTYLFLRWCVDRFGNRFLKELTQSNLTGVENIETASQTRFAELFRAWCVDLCLAGESEQTGVSKWSIPLQGRLERRLLAGVRFEELQADGTSQSYPLAPTSFLPVHVHAAKGQQLRVSVVMPPQCQPQLTLVRLADDRPRVSLDVHVHHETDDLSTVQLRLDHHQGKPIQWETISWEWATLPQVKTEGNFKEGTVHPWSDVWPENVSTTGGHLETKSVVVEVNPRKLVFKAFGKDATGKPVRAWGTAEGPTSLADRSVASPLGRGN